MHIPHTAHVMNCVGVECGYPRWRYDADAWLMNALAYVVRHYAFASNNLLYTLVDVVTTIIAPSQISI